MKAHLTTETNVYIACPSCGARAGMVTYFLHKTESFGPWYCDDCGAGYTGKVNSPTDIDISVYHQERRKTLVLLKLEPIDPVYFVVEGIRTITPGIEDDKDADRYYYESHTCPTNWMKYVAEVFIDGECDPHGMADYVRTVDDPGYVSDYTELFPEINEDKMMITFTPKFKE